MSTAGQEETPLDELGVADRANFQQGPPHELFRRLRSECPVHWSDGITEYPDEDGFWSVTTAEDVYEVSRDWETFSSAIGGFTATKKTGLSLEMQQAMFIGMDPPKHDRLKALFQRGFARTATRDTELRGQSIREGEKLVMWYPSSNRDESRYEDAERFDIRRNPEHQVVRGSRG